MPLRKLFSYALLILFTLTLMDLSVAHASDIKERMKQRLPALKELKARGIIGENNLGYLEFRQASGPDQALVEQENDDRKKVYFAIAKKTGATVQSVGQRRAVQISEIDAPGTWIQSSDGQWQRK